MRRFVICILSVCLIAFVTGCKDKSRPADLPPLTNCIVSVTQNDKPLEGAVVNLVGDKKGPNSKYQASGVTDAQGKANMKTYGYEGVPEGQYKVCIWKDVTEGGKEVQNADGEKTIQGAVEYRTVDLQYFSEDKTPLKIDITSGKMPETNFNVGKSIKKAKVGS